MAINKAVLAALKAISYARIDVKKTYKLERTIVNAAHFPLLKPFYKTWDHKVSCGDHEVPVRLFSPPEGQNPVSILLFFHGGGWVTGNIDSYNKVCMAMARLTGSLVISVDYRLAPEYRFPCALDDCYQVAEQVFMHTDKLFHMPPEKVTLIGDSAGGNLAAAVSLMARDRGDFVPANQILLYPCTHSDHSETSPFPSVHENGTDYLLTSERVNAFLELYQSCPADQINPYFAPLMAADFSNQPRTLIMTAEYDPLRDEGEAYGKKLKEGGNAVEIVRMKDALHGFISLPSGFSQVQQAYTIINRFLREVPNCECKECEEEHPVEPSGQCGEDLSSHQQ